MGDTSLTYDSLEFGETMTNLTQNLLGKQIACLSLPHTALFFFPLATAFRRTPQFNSSASNLIKANFTGLLASNLSRL